jgi:uncharacterized protein YndB with AHSA1/START domain
LGNLRLYRRRPEGLSDVSAFVQEMWSDHLEALPEDHSVEHEIWINARPETVWRYWIDPARICDWWGASAELDPRPGGTCLVRLGGDTVMRGEFVELTPYRRIVFN